MTQSQGTSLKDKVAIVTGASVGIGKQTALLLAQRGARVAVNSQSQRGQAVAQAITDAGGKAIFIQGSVEEEDDACRIVAETVKALGRLDVLVNNAGIVAPGRVDDGSIEDFDRTMAVNVRGVFLMSKFAVQQMLSQSPAGGSIVHNASVAAVKGLKDRAAYSASKGAVVALTKAMAMDYVDKKIRVNCVNPGTTFTPSLEERINAFDDPAAARKMFESRQPMGRLGEPDEIAAVIAFLASDEASFMTGAVVNVDGGLSI